MYYKKYGELPRIPNTKSEPIVSDICEVTNQLDKLESESMMELLNEQARKNAVREEAKLDSEMRPKQAQDRGSEMTVKSEPVAKLLKTEPCLDKNSTKDFDSDDELSEAKENKSKGDGDQSQGNNNNNNNNNNNIQQQSSFVPVNNSKFYEVPSKVNVSSSSPKPAFSPLNLMNPGPSQSPIPSFNPL